jgi:hypothetical protein
LTQLRTRNDIDYLNATTDVSGNQNIADAMKTADAIVVASKFADNRGSLEFDDFIVLRSNKCHVVFGLQGLSSNVRGCFIGVNSSINTHRNMSNRTITRLRNQTCVQFVNFHDLERFADGNGQEILIA